MLSINLLNLVMFDFFVGMNNNDHPLLFHNTFYFLQGMVELHNILLNLQVVSVSKNHYLNIKKQDRNLHLELLIIKRYLLVMDTKIIFKNSHTYLKSVTTYLSFMIFLWINIMGLEYAKQSSLLKLPFNFIIKTSIGFFF